MDQPPPEADGDKGGGEPLPPKVRFISADSFLADFENAQRKSKKPSRR